MCRAWWPRWSSMSQASPHPFLKRVVSGGQTGVDRAALDAALFAGIPCGGWCPRGRRAEDGALQACYVMEETPTDDYAERTLWNVRDSDGTLVLTNGDVEGGTLLTMDYGRQLKRPMLHLDFRWHPEVDEALAWIEAEGIYTLNVAGPRESKNPGIYARARAYLDKLFAPHAP